MKNCRTPLWPNSRSASVKACIVSITISSVLGNLIDAICKIYMGEYLQNWYFIAMRITFFPLWTVLLILKIDQKWCLVVYTYISIKNGIQRRWRILLHIHSYIYCYWNNRRSTEFHISGTYYSVCIATVLFSTSGIVFHGSMTLAVGLYFIAI